MRTARLEVLSQEEIGRIHAASMEILSTVGVQVDYQTARDIFRRAGADVYSLLSWTRASPAALFRRYSSISPSRTEPLKATEHSTGVL